MKLELRTEQLRKVRIAQMVPGVMYGKSIDSISVQASDKELKKALETYGKSMTFKVKIEGKTHFVYIKNIQTTILRPKEIIHFDLHRVSETDTLTNVIPLVFIGKEVFHTSKLYAQEEMTEVQAEYLPGHGVSKIEIDVSKLELGEFIQVKDIDLGENLKIIEDPEQVIVSIKEVTVVLDEDTDDEEGEIAIEAQEKSEE